ncbi:MAG: hypothetical protein LBL72_07805 [Candidatus Accumulibacter sp.]|jgi:hypothetical protein|nr:hypothetical protein [Accumulibacter sp.]
MKNLVKRALNKLRDYVFGRASETALTMQGKQLALLKSMLVVNPKSLADFEFRVFSQWGEDGIIDWLVESLSPLPQVFIEFGVDNYRESNTRFLLMNRNWRGLVIDGSEDNVEQIKASNLYWRHDLTACARFITRENIDGLFEAHGFSGEIGLLSVDIDGNDYWVWEAIQSVSPAIVVCEYCAHFGDIHPISIPYRESFSRFEGHYSGQYFGASVKAFIHLAKRKGYTFIGTGSSGVNVFFVRDDLIPRLGDKRPPVVSFPMRCSDARDERGKLSFVKGEARSDLLRRLPVVNVETGIQTALGDLGVLYSDAWRGFLRGAPEAS